MADEDTTTTTPDASVTVAAPTTPRKRTTKAGTKRAAPSARGRAALSTADHVRQQVNGAELDLEEHVAGLSEQLADLAERVERFAAESAAGARDLVTEVSHAGAVATRRAGRQIVSSARAVRDDPLPTAIAFGVLALVAAVVLSRRDDRW